MTGRDGRDDNEDDVHGQTNNYNFTSDKDRRGKTFRVHGQMQKRGPENTEIQRSMLIAKGEGNVK